MDKEPKGKLVKEYGEIQILEGHPYFFYDVIEPKLTNEEKKILENLKNFLGRRISFNRMEDALKGIPDIFLETFRDKIVTPIESDELMESLPEQAVLQSLKVNLVAFIKQYLTQIKNPVYLANKILDDTIGFGPISALMRDEELEEIMVNGTQKNVFVLHRQFGMCKTNVVIQEKNSFIPFLLSKTAKYAQRRFGLKNPLLDARLPDGSRANATFNSITPFGHTLTVRKFNYTPLSVIDLIKHKTISSELAGFMWLMVEGMNIEPMNILFTGGTSSGKTTTLNAMASFIPPKERIVTIEDTIEINLGSRENWIQMESKPKSVDHPETTMNDLLKNSLRMRPDRLMVGEVRGAEAQTMFVAMDTGHRGLFGTLHANTARETIIRLKSPPMSVPEQMLPLLDLLVVHYRVYDREKGLIRRVAQVTEISRMDEQVLLGNVYEWNPKKDEIVRTDIPSHVIQTLSEKTGMGKKALKNEMIVRQRILEWMLENDICNLEDVTKIIQEYYFNPNAILEKVSK